MVAVPVTQGRADQQINENFSQFSDFYTIIYPPSELITLFHLCGNNWIHFVKIANFWNGKKIYRPPLQHFHILSLSNNFLELKINENMKALDRVNMADALELYSSVLYINCLSRFQKPPVYDSSNAQQQLNTTLF